MNASVKSIAALDFLDSLAQQPELRERFERNPSVVLRSSGLSRSEKLALRSLAGAKSLVMGRGAACMIIRTGAVAEA